MCNNACSLALSPCCYFGYFQVSRKCLPVWSVTKGRGGEAWLHSCPWTWEDDPTWDIPADLGLGWRGRDSKPLLSLGFYRRSMPAMRMATICTASTGPLSVSTWSTLSTSWNTYPRSTWWTVCWRTSPSCRYDVGQMPSGWCRRQLPYPGLWPSPPSRLQVVTNRDTQETLLCIAYVFEVSASEHGAQHHIYRLVKEWETWRAMVGGTSPGHGDLGGDLQGQSPGSAKRAKQSCQVSSYQEQTAWSCSAQPPINPRCQVFSEELVWPVWAQKGRGEGGIRKQAGSNGPKYSRTAKEPEPRWTQPGISPRHQSSRPFSAAGTSHSCCWSP
jgi:hypothetical protein